MEVSSSSHCRWAWELHPRNCLDAPREPGDSHTTARAFQKDQQARPRARARQVSRVCSACSSFQPWRFRKEMSGRANQGIVEENYVNAQGREWCRNTRPRSEGGCDKVWPSRGDASDRCPGRDTLRAVVWVARSRLETRDRGRLRRRPCTPVAVRRAAAEGGARVPGDAMRPTVPASSASSWQTATRPLVLDATMTDLVRSRATRCGTRRRGPLQQGRLRSSPSAWS